ncbi:rhomboid family intramembrane serine protease [Sutcliffiella rhizosphaerae]|uniref:Rhomboid protease GlpG n=1 Tax=Sutcliffiella rhizosphaerae TaxID=2880967 RepID=A0ABM8YTT2_9BACI|nr:rhomboid family intramembrane serine protease [Sutcliffiella rhizosphaerae]CAG9623370.1 Rhomboid protease GlpG [Sutcliffiella rhizosphaerae]
MFVRTENFRTFTRLYPIITTIVAIHLILFLTANISQTFLNYTIGFNLLVWEGEYWRLVTPIFLHVSLTHFLFNSLSLVLFGPAVERMLGPVKFTVFYVLGGILANVATLLLHNDLYSHLGASGAIFAIFGLYFYMVFLRPDLLDSANSQVILTILVIGLVMTFLNPGINVVAHLFGFFAGTILAPFFLGRGTASRPRSLRSIFPSFGRSHAPRSSKQSLIWIILIALVLFGILSRYI